MVFLIKLIQVIVFIMVPILIYLIANICMTVRQENKYFLTIVLIVTNLISFFLCDNEYPYMSILINIPLIIACFKDLKVLSCYLLITNICFYYIVLEYPIMIIIVEYLIYLLLYIILMKKMKVFNLLLILIIIKSFFTSFLYFYYDNMLPNREIIVYILIVICLCYLITSLILKLFSRIEDIFDTMLLNKNLTDEKRFKTYMFKITHEIKNPIAVCKGYLDMMDVNNIDKTGKYIDIIRNEMNRTLTILSDVLDYSKIKVDKDIMDIVLLVEETITSYRELLKGKNIELQFLNKYEELFISGDYNRLKQVLVNLVKNAIEAKIDNEKLIITVNIKVINNKVNIIIKDNGIGIKNEIINNIGVDFFTTKKNGTGLGVSISKDIISKHGGSLLYESNKGKGTTVKVMLPINCKL